MQYTDRTPKLPTERHFLLFVWFVLMVHLGLRTFSESCLKTLFKTLANYTILKPNTTEHQMCYHKSNNYRKQSDLLNFIRFCPLCLKLLNLDNLEEKTDSRTASDFFEFFVYFFCHILLHRSTIKNIKIYNSKKGV